MQNTRYPRQIDSGAVGANGVIAPLIDIATRIENAFVRHGDRAAMCIQGRRYSYVDLQRRTLAIQTVIESNQQPLIAVAVNDSLDTYAAILAILRAGRAFVPLNSHHPAQRNAMVLTQAGVQTLLAPDASTVRELRYAFSGRIVATEEAHPGNSPRLADRLGELAYLLFTSGSTGEPKGVPISRANLSAFLDSLETSGYGITEFDRVLQMFDLTFDFSIASYLAPLTAGAAVFTVPAAHAKYTEVYRLLSEEKLTVAPLVPSVLNYLKPYFHDIKLPQLRMTVLCGEALLQDVTELWMQCAPFSRIANFYGPTEATVFAMVYQYPTNRVGGKSHNGIVSIGRPMPQNVAVIVDADLRPLATGQKGELCLAGPQLTPGYWRDEARNADAFFDLGIAGDTRRFYRTGDIAFVDRDGDYHFCGRIGTQLKIAGFRVELGEIEHHARTIAVGCECVVVPRTDYSGGTELNLVIENFQGDTKTLLTSLRACVPPYMVPRRVLAIDKLPMNANGKIDRIALAQSINKAQA